MRLLSIETSGSTCGACISTEGVLTSTTEVYRANVHEERLEQCVASALALASMSISDIDVVAFSAGPGSFTGLRIGVSFVKGLCFDGAIKLLGIDTSEALALASREVALACDHTVVHCVIPSHRDLFYIGTYGISDDGIVPQHANGRVELVTLQECRQRAVGGLVCGPGAPFVAPSPISGLTRLSSRFIALAAKMRLQTHPHAFDDAESFEPLYRQDWVAAVSTGDGASSSAQ